MSKEPDTSFFHGTLDVPDLLLGLQENTADDWPPDDAEIARLAISCKEFIDALHAWEMTTYQAPVHDAERGVISTADARRLLVKDVALSQEGDTSVQLVPGDEHLVGIELRAEVDEFQGELRRPEFVLYWQDDQDEEDGTEHECHVALPAFGPAWLMLDAVRNDIRQGRSPVMA